MANFEKEWDYRWYRRDDSNVFEENKKVMRQLMSSKNPVEDGVYVVDGAIFSIHCVKVLDKSTWFINGWPVVTFYKYTPCDIRVKIKLGRGDGETGERREEYEQFINDLFRALDCQFGCPFPDNLCDYYNGLEVQDNGYHPHDIAK